jgi:dihydrofolate synthase / folylpolyglutamate synthase
MKTDALRQYLERFPRFEVKPGLARIQRLLDALGQPHLAYPTIHVGGTNGKGSVVAMLDSVLRLAGLRVGRFTSPELIDFRDRIAVDGVWISETALEAAVSRLAPVLDGMDDVPSQFEVITAIAFDHFAQSGVDVAVIEVGLGGRYDATNVIDPELAILTNVTLDHQALLGDTVEAIAWEKAGIAKRDRILVTGHLPASVRDVVQAECQVAGALMQAQTAVSVRRVARDWQGATYAVTGIVGVDRVDIPLIGSPQGENLRLALSAVLALRDRGFEIANDAVLNGLRTVRWPGRFEVMQTRPTLVLDGAHNPAGIQSLAEDVAALVPNPVNRHLLYGTLADKDVHGVLGILQGVFPSVGVCASESPRALPVERLAAIANEYFERVTGYDSIADGMDAWRAVATDEDMLLVTGSLTVVGEARRKLMGAT